MVVIMFIIRRYLYYPAYLSSTGEAWLFISTGAWYSLELRKKSDVFEIPTWPPYTPICGRTEPASRYPRKFFKFNEVLVDFFISNEPIIDQCKTCIFIKGAYCSMYAFPFSLWKDGKCVDFKPTGIPAWPSDFIYFTSDFSFLQYFFLPPNSCN